MTVSAAYSFGARRLEPEEARQTVAGSVADRADGSEFAPIVPRNAIVGLAPWSPVHASVSVVGARQRDEIIAAGQVDDFFSFLPPII